MSPTTFILFAGIALMATVLAGLLRRPTAQPPAPPSEDANRWTVYRLRLDRLAGPGGAVVEKVPGGPVLVARRPFLRSRVTLHAPDGTERLRIEIGRRGTPWSGKRSARIRLGNRPFAELVTGPGGEGLSLVRSQDLDLDISGDTHPLELELRRGGKLVASVSPEIAPAPGSVGLESLSGEDPLPPIAVALALGLLRVLLGPLENPPVPEDASAGRPVANGA